MGNYISDIQSLLNYSVVINKVSNTDYPLKIAGLINDESTSFNFGVETTSFSSLYGDKSTSDLLDSAAGAVSSFGGKYAKKIGNLTRAASAVMKGASAVSRIREAIAPLESSTLKRPKGWTDIPLKFSVTFFEGQKIAGVITSDYKTFVKNLAYQMLPDVTAGSFESKQISWATLTKGVVDQATGGVRGTMNFDVTEMGFSIRLGSIFSSPGGWWMTSAPITTPNVFDSKGVPIVWTVDFEFSYFKQVTLKDFESWMA